jgi:hypothetical protein
LNSSSQENLLVNNLLALHLFLVRSLAELEAEIFKFVLPIFILTSYSNMLCIIVLLKGYVPAGDHALEVPGGDQADVGQGQLARGGWSHQMVLKFKILESEPLIMYFCFV